MSRGRGRGWRRRTRAAIVRFPAALATVGAAAFAAWLYRGDGIRWIEWEGSTGWHALQFVAVRDPGQPNEWRHVRRSWTRWREIPEEPHRTEPVADVDRVMYGARFAGVLVQVEHRLES